MRFIIAILLPPLAVILCGKPLQSVLNFFLTLLFWVPGMIHALVVVANHKADQRTDRLISAMYPGGTTGGFNRTLVRAAKLGLFILLAVGLIVFVSLRSPRQGALDDLQSDRPAPTALTVKSSPTLDITELANELVQKGFVASTEKFQDTTMWTWSLRRGPNHYQCQALGDKLAAATWASAQFNGESEEVNPEDTRHFFSTFGSLAAPAAERTSLTAWAGQTVGKNERLTLTEWKVESLRYAKGASITIARQ